MVSMEVPGIWNDVRMLCFRTLHTLSTIFFKDIPIQFFLRMSNIDFGVLRHQRK